MVVGDDAQCLVEGTLVTMADGVQRADRDDRGRGRGAVGLRQRRLPRGAGAQDVTARLRSEGIAITTGSGGGS